MRLDRKLDLVRRKAKLKWKERQETATIHNLSTKGWVGTRFGGSAPPEMHHKRRENKHGKIPD